MKYFYFFYRDGERDMFDYLGVGGWGGVDGKEIGEYMLLILWSIYFG